MDEEAKLTMTSGRRAPTVIPAAWFLTVAVVVVLLDQVSKWLIVAWLEPGERFPKDSPLRLVHVTNSGAAFGLFEGAGALLAVASVIGVAAIMVYLFSPGFAHPLLRFGLALMLGGATGNLVDRVRNGEVVDFLKVPNWPAFNVADSAISIGVVLLLWTMTTAPRTPDGS